MNAKTAKFIATFGYTGLCPVAPGTAGSLAATLLGIPLLVLMPKAGFILLLTLVYFIGVKASNAYMNHIGIHDPGAIVIDEVAGILATIYIAFDHIHTTNIKELAVSGIVIFLSFRFFDIIKPWPISWADKKLTGGNGVMFDDVLAGIFAGLISHFTLYAIYN